MTLYMSIAPLLGQVAGAGPDVAGSGPAAACGDCDAVCRAGPGGFPAARAGAVGQARLSYLIYDLGIAGE